MATITVSVAGSSVGTITITESLEGDNADRVLAYLLEAYRLDLNGQARTPTEVVATYWAGVRADLFERVLRFEQEAAAQAARDAVEPVTSETSVS